MSSGSEHDKPGTPGNPSSAKREPKHWLEYAIFGFVIATAIATGFAAWYTRQQWLAAVDYEQRQTRAYVFLRDIRLEKSDDAAFDIIPEWENGGNSETVHMHSRINRHLSDTTLPDGFSFGDISSNDGTPIIEVPVLLGPRSVSNITFDKILTGCLTQFNRGDGFAKFYLWGWVAYDDTLTNEHHLTRFCWDVGRIVFSADGKSARISHALCNSGNCADHDCPTPEKQIIQLRQAACKPDPTPPPK